MNIKCEDTTPREYTRILSIDFIKNRIKMQL